MSESPSGLEKQSIKLCFFFLWIAHLLIALDWLWHRYNVYSVSHTPWKGYSWLKLCKSSSLQETLNSSLAPIGTTPNNSMGTTPNHTKVEQGFKQHPKPTAEGESGDFSTWTVSFWYQAHLAELRRGQKISIHGSDTNDDNGFWSFWQSTDSCRHRYSMTWVSILHYLILLPPVLQIWL